MVVDINLDKKVLNSYKIYIDELKEIVLDTKVIIITNPTISKLHLDTILGKIKSKECHVIEIPDGEKYKNLDTINYILEQCFEHRLDRKSILIAFGGGVIGDMSGFVASLYQRGINFIQVPTTLLAQVDASVGGKTGINNKYGKNLIGSFWQPKAVYCDPSFLKTLPKREFSAGVAEIIKMAVMFDEDFFKFLENSSLHVEDNLKIAIEKCVSLKAQIVAKDEREEGIRAVLNYGHTFAHVIENETNYSTFVHGEAVSVGMIIANQLALKLNLINQNECDRVKNLLVKYDLPIFYKIKDAEKFYNTFFLDKKSQNQKIKFILPKSLGNHIMEDDIEKEMIINILQNFCN